MTSDLRSKAQHAASADAHRCITYIIGELRDAEDKVARQEDIGNNDAADCISEFLACDLPVRLVANLGALEFEVRKDVGCLISTTLRLAPLLNVDQHVFDYVQGHPQFFAMLVEGYTDADLAVHCGNLLRSCARHRPLVECLFKEPALVSRLLDFTRHECFDISSDALSILHDFSMTHKTPSAMYLQSNFKDFFSAYHDMLQSATYVTQRQALKLLGDILLDRSFQEVMMQYVANADFLKIHMLLLLADSKSIQIEAFHVFKIFVANPNKTENVQRILCKNKEKLIRKVEALPAAGHEEKQLNHDKANVSAKLNALPSFYSVAPRACRGGVMPTSPQRGIVCL